MNIDSFIGDSRLLLRNFPFLFPQRSLYLDYEILIFTTETNEYRSRPVIPFLNNTARYHHENQ